jgi:uncharacterized protein YidB (DUF937 family)
MAILDDITSALGSAGSKQNDLMSVVMNLIGGQSGGLNGLINKFSSQGLGNIISSWVGTGSNLPVSVDQIHKALGSDTIKELASKTGMDSNELSGQLSNLLPQIVDKLTPEGKVPEGDVLTRGKDLLGELFGAF